MRNNLIKTINYIISSILIALGFSACDTFGTAEYGCPHADFIVKGKVTAEQTGEPIKDIRVTMIDTLYAHHSNGINLPSARTDTQGSYWVKSEEFPKTITFLLTFSDTDSTLNGAFASLDTIIIFKNPQFTGGDGHWYSGTTSKEINIKLKQK